MIPQRKIFYYLVSQSKQSSLSQKFSKCKRYSNYLKMCANQMTIFLSGTSEFDQMKFSIIINSTFWISFLENCLGNLKFCYEWTLIFNNTHTWI